MHFQNRKIVNVSGRKSCIFFIKRGKIGEGEEKTGRIDKLRVGCHNTSIETIIDLGFEE